MPVHIHSRPAEMKCACCGSTFAPVRYDQRFCSEKCARTSYGRLPGRHTCGPCPTCGEAFPSRLPGKKYCSLKCYIKSAQFQEMRTTNLKRLNRQMGVPRTCKACGAEYQRSRGTFCSRGCQRRYFAERFDRWIANPETVALPQNFDEFLARDVLTCPVAGCEWEGVCLSTHVNLVHGVPARDFKKLCGFNVKTGLVGEKWSKQKSDQMKEHYANGIIGGHLFAPGEERSQRGTEDCYVSLEMKEHQQKARAEMPATRDVFLKCPECNADVQQPFAGRKLYCSVKCRKRFYAKKEKVTEVRCACCGQKFMASRAQARRVANQLSVCCSPSCRNHLNMAALVASRRAECPQT